MEEDEFPENAMYNAFESGATSGYGTSDGFNTHLKLNDPNLFTDFEKENNEALKRFLETDEEISISFVAYKSSTRESEWAIHKPHLTFDTGAASGRDEAAGLEEADIAGAVERYPGPDAARISTFVINHDATLARLKQSVIIMENGAQAGQMIYKHPPQPEEA